MTNFFDTPAIDFLDYGDHSGLAALFTQAGLDQETNEYHFTEEHKVPVMQKLA